MHTADTRPIPLRRALAAGAQGAVLKSESPEHFVSVLSDAANGAVPALSPGARELTVSAVPHLSAREIEVLRLLAAGIPRKAVGHAMRPTVQDSTVTTYVTRVADKYRAVGRPVGTSHDCVLHAIHDGYLEG